MMAVSSQSSLCTAPITKRTFDYNRHNYRNNNMKYNRNNRWNNKLLSFLLLGVLVVIVVLSSLPGCSTRLQRRSRNLSEWEKRVIAELQELEQERDDNDDGQQCGVGSFNEQVVQWMNELDTTLRTHLSKLSYANWNYVTNLTDSNAQALEAVQSELDLFLFDKVSTARTYQSRSSDICNQTALRLVYRLVNYNSVPIAANPATRTSINHLVNSMSEIYGTATVTKDGKTYRLEPELTDIMANSRDSDVLLWAWVGWHNASGPPVKPLFTQLVADMNEAAVDNGYPNVGVAWDMSDFEMETIEPMLDELYDQIRPFYEELHAYVRSKLSKVYPSQEISSDEPIPAHLLGNMWAQSWTNIYDLVVPYPDVTQYDVTERMNQLAYTAKSMFQVSEQFFTSLGLDLMTQDFWDNSLITRPPGPREVQCHGSAEDFYTDSDFRIKMCTSVNYEDLQVVHHEMGHIEYFMLYRHQPTLFRTGANAAFHEAVGDTIALSVSTPGHLKAIGLVSDTNLERQAKDIYRQDINFLMRMALQKISFIPFAYMIEKWRFKVFRSEIKPDHYNSNWWKIRERYQGVRAPVHRTEADFDPAAKYHVAANVPYSRYFLSFIGQFQFHEALCDLANYSGPLHKCDIYKSTQAGDRLKSVLGEGARIPWPEAMRAFTGQPDFNVKSLLRYFKPLINWLKIKNRNTNVGW